MPFMRVNAQPFAPVLLNQSLICLAAAYPFPPSSSPVSIESTGALTARVLFKDATKILAEKAESLRDALTAVLKSAGGGLLGPGAAAQATIAAMRTEPDNLAGL